MREQVRNLINIGKERGYLLSEEVDQVLPADVHSSEEIDDLLSTFERIGIVIYEDITAAQAARAASEPTVSLAPSADSVDAVHVSEDNELDLTAGVLDKNNDPVRLYLREVG